MNGPCHRLIGIKAEIVADGQKLVAGRWIEIDGACAVIWRSLYRHLGRLFLVLLGVFIILDQCEAFSTSSML